MEPSHRSRNSPIHWPTDWATHRPTHQPIDQLTEPPTFRPSNQQTNWQGVQLHATYNSFFTAINPHKKVLSQTVTLHFFACNKSFPWAAPSGHKFKCVKEMFDSAKQQNLSDKYSIQMSMTNSAISSNRLPKLKPSANASNNFRTNQGVFKSLNAASD